MTAVDLASGRYLRPLARAEELALFLEIAPRRDFPQLTSIMCIPGLTH